MLRNLRGVLFLECLFFLWCPQAFSFALKYWHRLKFSHLKEVFYIQMFALIMVLHLSVDPVQRGKRALNDMNQPVMLLKRALTLLDDSEIATQSIQPWLKKIKSWNGMWFVKAYNSPPSWTKEEMRDELMEDMDDMQRMMYSMKPRCFSMCEPTELFFRQVVAQILA